MPRVDLVCRSQVSRTVRARQLEAMFDMPASKQAKCEWHFDVPLEAFEWHVGLIVGPSGAGKSSVARALFGERVDVPLTWTAKSVVDDFDRRFSMQEIAEVCQAVGFNTIPAWLRPFHVLSTGERFRVELARRLLELGDPVVVDEFSSVVDRQVAKIGAHAVQKFVRRRGRQFVAVTCHYDVVDWLLPDWVLEPHTGKFARRCLQPGQAKRPSLDCEIARVDPSAWDIFAPFHYLSSKLRRGAACSVLFCEGQPASFAAVTHQPHPRSRDIKTICRAVTLPDWQGLGLIFHLIDRVAGAYKAHGFRVHITPAHPAFIRACDRSPTWRMVRRPFTFSPGGPRSHWRRSARSQARRGGLGLDGQSGQVRPCATFRYIGPALPANAAAQLVGSS